MKEEKDCNCLHLKNGDIVMVDKDGNCKDCGRAWRGIQEPTNTKITIEIEVTPRQMKQLPYDIDYYLELAALRELGMILQANCQTDVPHREYDGAECPAD